MTMSGGILTPVGDRLPADTAWLFPEYDFEQMDLEHHRGVISLALGQSDQFEVSSEQDGMLFSRLFGVEVSLIHQRHPLLERTVEYQDLQLASPTDIGLMKLTAINSRGTRRDFVDLFCLQGLVTLDRFAGTGRHQVCGSPQFPGHLRPSAGLL